MEVGLDLTADVSREVAADVGSEGMVYSSSCSSSSEIDNDEDEPSLSSSSCSACSKDVMGRGPPVSRALERDAGRAMKSSVAAVTSG